MKKYLGFLLVFTVLFATQCKQTTTMADNPEKKVYGEDFKVKKVTNFADLMDQMSANDTIHTILQAKVEGVCQVKGCWMNLVSSDKTQEGEIFVKFKDYGFFMPLDLSGNEVLVNGKAYKEITSVDELKHYAEDEGQTAEEIALITEPVEEFKMLATGVKILP